MMYGGSVFHLFCTRSQVLFDHACHRNLKVQSPMYRTNMFWHGIAMKFYINTALITLEVKLWYIFAHICSLMIYIISFIWTSSIVIRCSVFYVPFRLSFRQSHGFSGFGAAHKPLRAFRASFSHCLCIFILEWINYKWGEYERIVYLCELRTLVVSCIMPCKSPP